MFNSRLKRVSGMRRFSFLFFCAAMAMAVAQTASVQVDAGRVVNKVSPRMYAAFMEMMAEDVKWGLTAEMVHDRSFEEAANYLGLPAGWRLEPDERNDNVAAIKFAPVTEEAYPKTNRATGRAEHSLLVTTTRQDIKDDRRGFSQGRLSIRTGQRYDGYVWIKTTPADGYKGEIAVALEEDNTDGQTYARAQLPVTAGTEWQQVRFSLTSAGTDRFAKLSFLFAGTGKLYLDGVSLQPANAKGQVRADVEEMIAKLRPSFLRWPGGNVAQDYHWQWGIGPRDERPVWTNVAWSNAPEPGDFGTDEYLAFCARLGIEPSITVNVNGGTATAEEAANWVEYVNGPATSRFGAMRAANGHPAPYGVKQWELGNEVFGNWVRGHSSGETYARAAMRYANAMKAVDPSIKFTAVGQGVGKERDTWNSAVLTVAGPLIDYLAIHDYTTASSNAGGQNSRAAMMARAGEFERGYRHTAELIARLAPGRPIKQIVNEWNLFYGADTIQSTEGAVYASRMMNGFERDGDTVEANCISDLLNGWVGGVIQASRDRVYGTAQYYAIQLYNDHLGTERLAATTKSPPLTPGVDAVDAVATRAADGSKVYVKLSNAEPDRSTKVTIDLQSFSFQADVEVKTLSASSHAGGRNSFAQPQNLQPVSTALHCSGACTVTMPPMSVAVATFVRR